MLQVIFSEPGAWIIRIPRPAASPGRLVRALFTAWWHAWQTIAADLGRGGIR